MKPQTATTAIVLTLLACSALTLGLKHAARGSLPGHRESASSTGSAVDFTATAPPRLHPDEARTEDPAAALTKRLKAVLALGNRTARMRALLAFADSLKPGERQVAVEALKTLPVKNPGPEMTLLIDAWTEADHEGAMAWGKAGRATNEGLKKYRQVMEAWARHDPEEALAWLKARQGTPEPDLEALTCGAIEGMDKNLEGVTRILQDVPEGEARSNIAMRMPVRYHLIMPERVVDWLASLDPVIRRQVLPGAMTGPQDLDYRLAVMSRFPEDFSPGDLAAVYQGSAALQPQEAMAALERVPPGEGRRMALLGTLTGLAQSRLPEALELMRRRPEEVTGEMLVSMARQMRPENAAALLEEVARFPDPAAVEDGREALLTTWEKADPEGTQNWRREHRKKR